MIVITGAAGFIGSALLWALNERGESNILLVDDVGHDEKECNIAPLKYEELVGIKEFRERLRAGDYDPTSPRLRGAGIEAILHMGACSSTTETDWEYLLDNNVEYSKDIIRWCSDRGARCVYASSGATYGDGARGYSDDHALFGELVPLNLYGKSKLLVDIWARDGGYLNPPTGGVAGVRYFNVFGPNEYHKGEMASVPFKKFHQMQQEGVVELFKSNHPDFGDGEQKRDFIYIKDVLAATLWLLDHREAAGIYNVGTGKARSWNDVARAMFFAVGKMPNIRYVDMPANLKNQYQNFTQADISKLRATGYGEEMTELEDAIADYVQNYLIPKKSLGE